MKHCLFLLLFMLSTLTVHPQESTASAHVGSFTLYSPQLKAERRIWVYLPHNYSESNRKFPVIYMHDGQNLFDRKTSAFGKWKVDETLDSLKAQAIVIGIEHGGERRIAELTPYPNPKHGGGGADAYLDFVVNALKPHIEKTYRVKTGTENTFIMGSSLGGLVSFYALLKYPAVFGGAGVFSPSFWFSDDIYAFAEKVWQIDGRIYFMAGDSEDEEMLPDLERMAQLLEPKLSDKNQFTKKIVVGGKHNEGLWSKQFASAYLWLMKKP